MNASPVALSRPARTLHLSAVLLLVLIAVGCGAAPPTLEYSTTAGTRDGGALAEAREAFFRANDVDALRKAVAAAKKAGPTSAEYHDLAAHLAFLEDRRGALFEHRFAEALDPANPHPTLTLDRLGALSLTLDEEWRLYGLVRALSRQHSRADVRAHAHWLAARISHVRGYEKAYASHRAGVHGVMPLAVIGPFVNDQGKGFDIEYPPERTIDLKATHTGKVVDLQWRTDYARDALGRIPLKSLMSPEVWQVAYGATGVEVTAAGDYEIRISTSDPLKIWVNDGLVFTGSKISRGGFDGLVVPVTLREGTNRVLFKSAQEKGGWSLMARLTGANGAPLSSNTHRWVAADTPYDGDPGTGATFTVDHQAQRAVETLPEGTATWAKALVTAYESLGVWPSAVRAAEAYTGTYSDSLVGRYQLALALWNGEERGRTADLLAQLDKEVGQELPRFPLWQAWFWGQQQLHEKARKKLIAVRARFPERVGATLDLARLFKKEKWHEDRCALLGEADALWPNWPSVHLRLAYCFEDLRFYLRAKALYEGLLSVQPNHLGALKSMHWFTQGNDEYDAALGYARRLVASYAHLQMSWDRLGETHRRRGERAQAEEAWRRLMAIVPTAATGHARLAKLALQAGERERAVELLRAALERDPENEKLANRIAFMAPTKEGQWTGDIPDEATIEAAIAQRASAKPADGANIVYLLDDEVTWLGADGSTNNVVTMVAHAVNQSGRDKLTRQTIRSGGRHRILQAYAIGPDGTRLEASSIRGRTVRFRQLKIGSSVVLQYRIDERADGHMDGHMARSWWFQMPNVELRRGRWVLWMPGDKPLRQFKLGDVQVSETTSKGERRVEWSAENVPPVLNEPGMPNLREVVAHVQVSTVPNWETFWAWEEALLRDAFRESPEVVQLAERLFKGAADPMEKVRRIQTYLMTDIRYQQDYERSIAGVKPHAAPVVVARQYGDCKDKAVLFITLARLAGIDVHFALVRTRDKGPVRKEVPMQQFNHVIVYIPPQEGIAEGRFLDPTVDALDVDILRHDDQGTSSLVFDPLRRTHTWREIPYQAAEMDLTRQDMVLSLARDGSAEGEIEVSARGRMGSFFRQASRNPKHLEQLLTTGVMSRAFPTGRLLAHDAVQVADVRRPARVRLRVAADSVGRREGQELRVKLPFGWSPKGWFALAERQFALNAGTPKTLEWKMDVELPDGARVKRVPASVEMGTRCIRYTREVRQEGKRVVAEQRVQINCARIEPADYALNREAGNQMLAAIDEELVIALSRR